jgi:UDP-2,4-diacetamido-2,4,6-trideoxy-beta-L-altropyranose hydrolase
MSNGGQVLFAQAQTTLNLESKLQQAGFSAIKLAVEPGTDEDAEQTAGLAQRHGAEWVVVDGYHFGGRYQQIIKETGLKLFFIDDHGHVDHYLADFILNQNISATESLYKNREWYTQLLLGTSYVLLRKEFDRYRHWRREISPVARKVLVTFGGSDPHEVTGRVLTALRPMLTGELECIAAVGGSNPKANQLQADWADFAPQVRIVTDASNMPELMAWADVTVSAIGTTSWELAFMGLPNVLITLADNQRATAAALNDAGVSISLGAHGDLTAASLLQSLCALLEDQERRSRMSEDARLLVDGYGSRRVTARIRGTSLNLRRVRPDDCEILWHWANDEEALNLSFAQDPIPWERHVKWFTNRLKSPDCIFYIAESDDGTPIGQIRYDTDGPEAAVSISLDRTARHRSRGAAIIIRASEQYFTESSAERILAYVKPENLASIDSFRVAGYSEGPLVDVNGEKAKQFVLSRS